MANQVFLEAGLIQSKVGGRVERLGGKEVGPALWKEGVGGASYQRAFCLEMKSMQMRCKLPSIVPSQGAFAKKAAGF